MELLKRNVPATCDIMFGGCKHFGNPNSDIKGINAALDWVMEKRNRYWVEIGDLTEATMTDHRYYSHDKDADPIPLQQAYHYVDVHMRARSRCLGIVQGNHDARLHRYGNLVRDVICKQLKVPYGGRMCKLKLTTNDEQICKVFLWHPDVFSLNSRAGTRQKRRANMIESLIRNLAPMFSDCLVMLICHPHKLLMFDPDDPNNRELILYDDDTDLHADYVGAGDGKARYIPREQRYYGAAGCFLRSYAVGRPSYAEKYPYAPVEIGYLVMHIRGGKVAGISKVVI